MQVDNQSEHTESTPSESKLEFHSLREKLPSAAYTCDGEGLLTSFNQQDTGSKTLPHGTETILLVEDDDTVGSFTCHILQMQGYAVLEARNGEEALRLAEQHRGKIHLLLTDVVMPRMGGRRVAERLAQMQSDVKVIFLSSYTNDALVRNGVLSSEVAFLQNPFSPSALTQKVREVMDR